MICPACDHILNATGCQSCGWKTGDPWPAARLVVGAAHPLKDRKLYPPPSGVFVSQGDHDMEELRAKIDKDSKIPLGAATNFVQAEVVPLRTVVVAGPTPVADHLPDETNSSLIEHQTVEYADGTIANGPSPLPTFSPAGFPAVKIDGVSVGHPQQQIAPKPSKKTKAEEKIQ